MAFPSINVHLLPLKALLFFFYGGMSCIWPFLTLHMKFLGLTLEEIAVINTVLPFVSAIGSPVGGILADKTGRHKLIVIGGILLSAMGFSSLLLIPGELQPETPQVRFHCNHSGSQVLIPACDSGDPCPDLASPTAHTFHLSNCETLCGKSDFASVTPAERHPEMCFMQVNSELFCETYNYSGQAENLYLRQEFQEFSERERGECSHPIKDFNVGGRDASFVYCPQESARCEVVCNYTSANSPYSRTCGVAAERSRLTFWLYMFLRIFAETTNVAIFPLFNSFTIAMTVKHGGEYGRQYLFGVISTAVFSVLSGFLIDFFSGYLGRITFAPCFITYDVLMLLCCVVTAATSCTIKHKATNWTKDIKRVIKNPIICILFLFVGVMGTVWGFMEVYVFLFLDSLHASKLLIGMTQMASVIAALPFLYKSEFFVKSIGHVNWMIVGFLIYVIRLTGYSFIVNPWWAVLLEVCKGFALYLPKVAFETYANLMTPKELTATVQAMVLLLHFSLGRGIGSLAGGYTTEILGARDTFQVAAVVSGLAACLYFLAHHFWLKTKEPLYRRPKVELKEKKQNPAVVAAEPLLNGDARK